MRFLGTVLSLSFVFGGFLVFPGCAEPQPEVAPATVDEIEEYKKQVYGAEQEAEAEEAAAAE